MTNTAEKKVLKKVLLREYDCELGTIMEVSKVDGVLTFKIAKLSDIKAVEYYIKRYGIQPEQFNIELECYTCVHS